MGRMVKRLSRATGQVLWVVLGGFALLLVVWLLDLAGGDD
jgi:hypothetical protein